jgi:hypothetical protein
MQNPQGGEMMRQIKLLTLAGMLIGACLALSSGISLAAAPAQAQQNSNFNLEGTITDRSPGKLTVNTQGEIIFHVSYNTNTKIYRKNGSAGSPSDLKVNAVIKVQGELDTAGVVEASRIDLE